MKRTEHLRDGRSFEAVLASSRVILEDGPRRAIVDWRWVGRAAG